MSRPLVDIRLETLSTRGGRPPGLDAVSVHVRYGEFFTFLGPPHSGKTDVLRAVAGFMPVTSGRILVDAQDIGALSPGQRLTGYVFQEGALWPHLTVREHVAFGLEQQGLAGGDVGRRVEVVAGRLGLAACVDRRPAALALAERRRLALARALAVEPRVLLLGEPAEVYQHPVSRDVAEALGPANFLPVRVIEVRDLGVVVETDGGHRIPVAGVGAYGKGSRGLLVLRPELLVLTEASMARGPGLPGTVTLRVFEGARHLYEVDIGAGQLVRVELASSYGDRIFRVGDSVRIETSSDTVVIVPEP